MKKILIFALAFLMLLSCIACSDTNNTDPADTTAPLPGSKYPLTSELPMEKRPPVLQSGGLNVSEKKPFDKNDPRKKYLEEKYGVTAYLVTEPTEAAPFTTFELEGYLGRFHMFSKEALIAMGSSEESITADYTDNAYYTVAYSEIYEYFAQAAKACGVTVDRMIIQARIGNLHPYHTNKSFAECLSSIANKKMKQFDIRFYGDFDNGDDSIEKLLSELDKLDFMGRAVFYNVLKDIGTLTNEDLMDYMASKDYVQQSKVQQVN